MIFSALFLLQTASMPLPKPFSDDHKRDIGCVATLAIVADQQRRGLAPSLRFPNVMQRGRVYSGIVGRRIVEETGQSKEAVGFAIQIAAESQQAEQNAVGADAYDAPVKLDSLMRPCLDLLDKEVPEEKPGPEDYLFCTAITEMTAKEIEAREGRESINARVMRALSAQLAGKYKDALSLIDAERSDTDLRDAIDREIAKQEELSKSEVSQLTAPVHQQAQARQACIFLGD